jgi:hypothetical protein
MKLEPGQTWVPTTGGTKQRHILWVADPSEHPNGIPMVGYVCDRTNPLDPVTGYDAWVEARSFEGWVRRTRAELSEWTGETT